MIITARKRSLGQGNIFTPVGHSVHRGGSPIKETPLGRRHPPAGRPPWEGGTLPAGRPPWDGGIPPGRETPGKEAPPAGRPPRREAPPPLGRRHTPPAGRPPEEGIIPPRRLLLRAVRILMECILVSILVFFRTNKFGVMLVFLCNSKVK